MRRTGGGRLSVLDVVLHPAVRYRRWRQAGLAVTMLLVVVFAGLRVGQGRPLQAAVGRTAAPVEVRVTVCPVPAGDYAGLRYPPQAAPATLSVPASLAPPANAQIFGTWFMPGQVAYLIGPESATCQAGLGAADGGENMAATPLSDRSAIVTMLVKAGGLGPSTDLACPYIPAVRAADEAFRLGDEPEGSTFCAHPPADVIRQIPTHTPSLYAAAVYVPPGVTDPNIAGSGGGTDPAIALYTAWADSGAADGQMVACTLAPAQGDICAASLKFFLATQSAIRTGPPSSTLDHRTQAVSAANLATMEAALSSFLAEQDIR